jgi:ribonuclease III
MKMEIMEEFVLGQLKDDGEKVLALALTPKSAASPNNERVEFLGNAVLNMRVAESVYRRDPELDPGTMSLMCNYLRSNPVLVGLGREGGLAVMLSDHNPSLNGKVTDRMVSTAVEAIIGALFEKQGYAAASAFVDRFVMVEDLVACSKTGKGPVTDLKELADRDRDLSITHKTTEQAHGGVTTFTHTTTVNGRSFSGTGRTKKIAEMMAASEALKMIGPADTR